MKEEYNLNEFIEIVPKNGGRPLSNGLQAGERSEDEIERERRLLEHRELLLLIRKNNIRKRSKNGNK